MSPTTRRPPRTLTLDTLGIPTQLTKRDQWVLWRWEWAPDGKGGGKWTKVPIDPRTGNRASTTDPTTWAPFSVALPVLEKRNGKVHGLGYVFSAQDPFAGIDLDDARDPETGALFPWAQAIIDRFDSYTEWSITGTGAHIIVEATVPEGGNRKGAIEMYDRARFFVMSGQTIRNGGHIGDRQDELDDVHRETFPEAYAPKPEPRPASTEPLTVDLDELRKRCDGNDKFGRLWRGDDRDYGDDTSSADLAFVAIVARNGGTRDQADALYRASNRARAKWDQKRGAKTYGERTLDQVYDGTVIPFTPSPRPATPESAPAPSANESADGAYWRTRAETAEARVQTLEAENAELRHENSMIINTIINPHLKAEAPTLIRTAIEVREARLRGDADEDGAVRIDTKKIGDDYGDKENPRIDGIDTPIRSRSTVGRHLKTAADLGLLEREIRKVMAPSIVRDKDNKPVIDPATQKPKTYQAATQQTWVNLPGDTITDLLRPFVFFRMPETMPGEPPTVKKHGGDRRSETARAEQAARRTPCPDCGSTDRQTYCARAGCGAVITEQAETDEAHLIAETKRLARLIDRAAATPAFQDDPLLEERGLTPRYQDETGRYFAPPTDQEMQQGLAVYAGHRPRAAFHDETEARF